MPLRLVALNGGPDIPIDRAIIVVGRHPACDTQLDSMLVSRRHCCIAPAIDELEVKDLGSTNGIRINGHRVNTGRLRLGDELSIARRDKVDNDQGRELTLVEPGDLKYSVGDVAPPAQNPDRPA